MTIDDIEAHWTFLPFVWFYPIEKGALPGEFEGHPLRLPQDFEKASQIEAQIVFHQSSEEDVDTTVSRA